jgi:hypothetical protein
MPEEIRDYLNKILEPALSKNEQKRKLLAQLQATEGRWPDYPKMIMELSKSEKLPIAGWSLPGNPQAWDRLRKRKIDVKPAN